MKMTTFAATSAMDFHRLQLWQTASCGSDRPLIRGIFNWTDGSHGHGTASCAFVTTKRHLPDLRLGRTVCSQLTDFFNDHERFRKQRPDSKAPSKRCGKGYVRGKAANYGSISAMIRDAVAHYDDTLMKRRIESMNLLYPLISRHEADLNRIGNNLNQVAHYCNVLAENGEYEMRYVTSAIEPVLHQLLSLNSDIAATEHKIFTRIFSEKPV